MNAMPAARRIVSFLPSATEMACALGLGDQLLGITHECDYPPEIRDKPVVVRNVLPVERMTELEIDTAVTERLRDGLSLYQVDEDQMRTIAPDLILTQDLCRSARLRGTKSRICCARCRASRRFSGSRRNRSSRSSKICASWARRRTAHAGPRK